MKTLTILTVLKGLIILLGLFSFTINADQTNLVSPKIVEPTHSKWAYEDQTKWLSLEQTQIDISNESYPVTALKSKTHTDPNTRKRIYVVFNETAEPNNGDALFIEGLAKQADVWYFDSSEALFIERTRNTLRALDGTFVKQVIEHASKQYQEIVVITYDAMSVPVLRGLRLWQESTDKTTLQRLKNLILLYPSLFINAPVAGETPELFPIAYNTALPITILQPAQGAQAVTIDMTARAFKTGGSLVDVEQVPIATDGYYKYQDIKEMAVDASQRVTAVSNRKITEVNRIKYQVANLMPLEYEPPKSEIIAGLVKIEEAAQMQTISLKALNGEKITVPNDYKGKALLVNFWATWCPHCVEEIPSMNRALEALDAERFAMISISYKDSKATLEEFVKKVDVDFPILMDLDGQVSKDWKVFAYPSSFLIDANGKIQYSINAGAIWDAPEMLEKLREVMSIPYQKP